MKTTIEPRFIRHLRWGVAAGMAMLLAGCAHFKAPTTDSEPHGLVEIVKLRVNIAKDFRYVPGGMPMGLASSQSGLKPFSPVPPSTLKKAPGVSGEILYTTLPLGNVAGAVFSVAMVNRKELYFDDNGNGDFSDDAAPCPELKCARNLSLAVRASDGSIERRPYAIWFWFIEEQGAPNFYSVCHYARDIQIGPATYSAVAYEQQAHNGLLGDDGLWIDLNRDGKMTEEEHFIDRQILTVAGKQYQLLINAP